MIFTPSVHGFPFGNWWEPGTPVIEVPTPLGTIPIGDAHGGVCGGMVFAAADYYLLGLPVPQEKNLVFKYFCKRLLESWHLPFGVLKYFDWQRRPTASTTIAGVSLIDGTARLTWTVEWPKVRSLLDGGGLAPLGLVKAEGLNPKDMGQHHQVLAYAYEPRGGAVAIRVYDPNHPGDDDAVLLLTPDENAPVVHSREVRPIRGFFLTDYEPREPLV
jgi:hypothetical protein